MVVIVESSAKFQSESQSADNSEIGPYITEEVSAAVVVLAQQSVGHRVGIECSEVVILSLESVGSVGVLDRHVGMLVKSGADNIAVINSVGLFGTCQ